jgi:DNA helicase-2/ATP-dependent DNA helicase PcrA
VKPGAVTWERAGGIILPGKTDYKTMLNPAQFEAVMSLEGPVLVIAGAGSGKTRTLVYRVARLIENGIDPEAILLLTFTRKAAQEMLERAASLSDDRCRFVSGGTFHSLAHRVLRSHGDRLGFSRAFTILDRSDMEEVINAVLPELKIDKGLGRFPKRATLANILSKAANLQKGIDHLMEEEYGQFLFYVPELEALNRLYQAYKKTHQMMDYDDLLINLRRLLKNHDDVRQTLSNKYQYIMVDEYQDTNAIQAQIVELLAHEHRNVMVVGDDSQAIYSFRGANYMNMFDFPVQFPDAKTIKLEENYRSTQPILSMTNAIMKKAQETFTKCLFTRRSGGELPRVIDTRTDPEQAMFVAQFIKKQMKLSQPLTELAVLFRAGYHSFELELELTRQNIPFVKYGGFKFMESAHIKDFLAHLRVVVNTRDVVSWGRILRLLAKIGQAKSSAIIDWMREGGIPPAGLGEWPGIGRGSKGLKALAQLFGDLGNGDAPPEEAVKMVMGYYTPFLQQKFDDYPKRQKELERLIPMASRYKKLRSFLDDLILDPPTSPADIEPVKGGGTVTLSTVHSAKGLEWSAVIIIWVMEGRFPPSRSYGNEDAMEEERRLMYVAATRAKDRLIMCYPSRESSPPWQMGGHAVKNGLSSFIDNLPEGVVTYETVGAPQRFAAANEPSGRIGRFGQQGSAVGGLSQGDRVRHPAFGAGVVSRFLGKDKVEILFRNFGRKLLHLEHTRLEKV